MLRHVVLFKWKDEASAAATQSVEEGLFLLAQTIPEIASYDYGPDLGAREGNFDFCLVAEFADRAAFEQYVVHPDHQRFISTRLTPVVAQRVSVQYEV